MAQLSLTINGRSYIISCDDGQETHITKLGNYLDEKMRDLSSAVGNVGEARLLVMAALLVTDELFDAKRLLQNGGTANTEIDVAEMEEAEASMAGALDAFAQRIEAIAARLEQA